MKPRDAFDICHARVLELLALRDQAEHLSRRQVLANGKIIPPQPKDTLASRGAMNAVRPDACAKDGPTKTGNPAIEYLADFERCGERVLTGRLLTAFRFHFCRNHDADHVAKHMGIRQRTFDVWRHRIRTRVGLEILRVELLPGLYKLPSHELAQRKADRKAAKGATA